MDSLRGVRLLGSLGLAAAAVLSGCAGADPQGGGIDGRGDGDGGDREERGLRELLAEPVAFAVADREGGSSARVTAVSLSDGETALVELSVVGGVVTLSLDDEGRVRFHDLLVDTEDVMVSPNVVPPDGLLLTDLTVELAEPAVVQLGPVGDDQLAAGADLSIDVRWAVEVEHGTVDLAPIRLPDLAFDFSVADQDGQLVAHLGAAHVGAFWSWAGIFELRDLELDLPAFDRQR